jgi:hypothetical protein
LLCSSGNWLFFTLFIPITVPSVVSWVNALFDETDNCEDEAHEHDQEADKDDSSLAILNYGVCHFLINLIWNLMIYRKRTYYISGQLE